MNTAEIREKIAGYAEDKKLCQLIRKKAAKKGAIELVMHMSEEIEAIQHEIDELEYDLEYDWEFEAETEYLRGMHEAGHAAW